MIRPALAACAALMLFSIPGFASDSSTVGGTATQSPKYAAVAMVPEWSGAFRMILSSSLFGTIYLISRRRK